MFLIPHLHTIIKYAILKITRGKPQAATRYKLKLFISTVRQLFPVVGGYFYLLLSFPISILSCMWQSINFFLRLFRTSPSPRRLLKIFWSDYLPLRFLSCFPFTFLIVCHSITFTPIPCSSTTRTNGYTCDTGSVNTQAYTLHFIHQLFLIRYTQKNKAFQCIRIQHRKTLFIFIQVRLSNMINETPTILLQLLLQHPWWCVSGMPDRRWLPELPQGSGLP